MASSDSSKALQRCDRCGASFGSRNKLFKHLEICGKAPAPLVVKAACGGAPGDTIALLGALRRGGSALQFATDGQRDDTTVCMVAVRQNGKALEHASPRVQAEPTVVMQAVQQNGCALKFANESLRNNREVAMAAVKQNRKALQFCGESLQNDPSFTVVALQRRGRTGVGSRHRSIDSTPGKRVKASYNKLWARRAGWHDATAREQRQGDVSSNELVSALAQSVAASSGREPKNCLFCASCGGASATGRAFRSSGAPCWACSGQAVLGLVLRVAGSLLAGDSRLDNCDEANLAQVCASWRTTCFLSRLPLSLCTEQSGRQWMQDWEAAFERCLESIPTSVVGNSSLAPINVEAGETLHMALKHVCTGGVMPDFSDSGALAHYAVENLTQRAQKTTAALLLDEARLLLSSLLLSPTRPALRVAAVGGGPGFEAVGLAVLADFLRVTTRIECLSMDIEAAWEPVLGAVVTGTHNLAGKPCCDVVRPESLQGNARPGSEPQPEPQHEVQAEPEQSEALRPTTRHQVAFVATDCLTGRAGPELLLAAPSMDLFTFNYCMVENAKALRADNFGYLRKVFSAATVGAVFIFMDAAYHLWQEVIEVFSSLSIHHKEESGGGTRGQRFAILHPHPQPCQCTNTMIVTKLRGT